MGTIVIATYKPKPGCEDALERLTRTHVPRLQELGLVTARLPIIMRAKDGTILEVFEWISEEAINAAHSDPAVMAMWDEYGQLCDYIPLAKLPEAATLFESFTPLN